jgi:TetR/AcrR family transcriptional repressor of lmrAB and yxaGH operons
MPASKVTDEALLEKVAEVFRSCGYEGATIRLLSEATGLERASLYHRFPGGKEEMAAAIIKRMCAWFEEHVFEPLEADAPLDQKLRRVADNLRDFYRRGTLWCVLDAMTLGGGSEAVRDRVRAAYAAWLHSFENAAREGGASLSEARARAQQALIEIEGSLVVARVTADSRPFLGVVKRLPALLAGLDNQE